MYRFRTLFLSLLLTSLVGLAWAVDSGKGGYKVMKDVPMTGDGGWDYLLVDSDARRLYVTHDTEVQVFDVDSLKVIGKIEGTKRAHGVALAPEYNHGFVTSGETGTVLMFDLQTFKTISEITAQPDADAIVYDPASHKVFTFNGDSENSTVIDAKTGKVVKTLKLGGKPEFAVADGKGHIYNNLEDKNTVVKIDTKKLKVTARWPTEPGDSPAGMAMDRESNRLFSGCHNQKVVVMNAANGKVVQTLPIGQGIDANYFDPESKTAFSSNGDGTLTVIHEDSPDQFSVVENAKTEQGARTMAFDPKTGRVFSVAAKTLAVTPTADNPHPWRRKIVPGTVHLVVIGK